MLERSKQIFLNLIGVFSIIGIAIWLIMTLQQINTVQTGQSPSEPTPIPLMDDPTSALTETVNSTVTPTSMPQDTAISEQNSVINDVSEYVLLYQTYEQKGEEYASRFWTLDIDPKNSVLLPKPFTFGEKSELEDKLAIYSVSPNGRYVLLSEPAGITGGHPYIYDWWTGDFKSFFTDKPSVIGRWLDWSKDGQKFLFWSDDVGGLWLVDVETGEEKLLTSVGGNVQGAGISPAGDYIAYIDTGTETFTDAIWLVPITGGEPELLFDIGSMSSNYGWSEYGILYQYSGVGKEKGQPPETGNLWVTDITGKERRDYDMPIDRMFGLSPVLSPDRTKLATTGLDPNEEYDCREVEDMFDCLVPIFSIFVLDLSNGEISKLGKGISPHWTSDSQNVVFLSLDKAMERTELWMADARGENLVQITDDGVVKSTGYWVKKEK